MRVNFKDLPKGTKTPILTYCRKLIKDGVNPKESLEIYRNHKDWDIRVLNIGRVAKLTVEETPLLGPRFVKYQDKGYLTRYKKNKKLEVGA